MTARIFRKPTISSAFSTRRPRQACLEQALQGQLDTRTGAVRGPLSLLV